MSILVLNTAVNPSCFLLFSDNWKFISDLRKDISGKEFDELLPTIHAFLSNNGESIKTVKKLYVVTGPISFTG